MKQEGYLLSFVMAVIIAGGLPVFSTAADIAPDSAQSEPAAQVDSAAAAAGIGIGEASLASAPVVFQLCTLTVSTVPEGASITLDGTPFGQSPLEITNIDTGSHVLLLQKVGYYQKKVALSLPESGRTALNFELSAPGRLVVVTEPPEVSVQINGRPQGITPFSDSLLKPGVYQITLSKVNYIPLEKTVIIPGGQSITLTDTLSFTEAYRATLAVPVVNQHRKERYFTMGIVAGVFSMFLLILAIVETRE